MEPGVTGILLFWIVLTLVVCGLGIIGNCLSGIILVQKEFRSSSTYILLGLTACDLLLLVKGFIQTLGRVEDILTWDQDGIFGTIIFFWDWISTAGTRYFTVAISVERYIAVCHPFLARKWMTEKRALMFSLSVFLFTVLLSIWSYVYANYISVGFAVYAAVILHFIPFFTVCALNVLIYFAIQRFVEERKKLTASETKEVGLTRMLLCVVLVFGICLCFEFIRRLLVYANYFDPAVPNEAYTINHLASLFYVLNSAVNFAIYFLMVRKFRASFYRLWAQCFRGCRKSVSRIGSPAGSSSMESGSSGTADTNIQDVTTPSTSVSTINSLSGSV